MFQFDFSNLLLQEVNVETPAVSQSIIMGAAVKSFEVLKTGIKASIQPMSGDKIESWGRMNIEVDNEVISDDPDLLLAQNGDRLTDQDGEQYIIKHMENAGGNNSVYEIYVKRIT